MAEEHVDGVGQQASPPVTPAVVGELLGKPVVVKETTARKGTDEKYEPAFDKPLKEGAEFTIVDESAGWVLGRFQGIGDGWLRKDAVVE